MGKWREVEREHEKTGWRSDMRTKDEIEAEIKKGEEFVKQHPRSIFGTDNKTHLRLFKRIIEMFQDGKTLDEIEDLISEAYEGDEQSTAFGVIDWLRGDAEEFW